MPPAAPRTRAVGLAYNVQCLRSRPHFVSWFRSGSPTVSLTDTLLGRGRFGSRGACSAPSRRHSVIGWPKRLSTSAARFSRLPRPSGPHRAATPWRPHRPPLVRPSTPFVFSRMDSPQLAPSAGAKGGAPLSLYALLSQPSLGLPITFQGLRTGARDVRYCFFRCIVAE